MEINYLRFLKEMVYECGAIRETRCHMCEDRGWHWDEVIDRYHLEHDGDRQRCEIDPAPDPGEKYECRDCQHKKTMQRRAEVTP
jgi:hypothetical protein